MPEMEQRLDGRIEKRLASFEDRLFSQLRQWMGGDAGGEAERAPKLRCGCGHWCSLTTGGYHLADVDVFSV